MPFGENFVGVDETTSTSEKSVEHVESVKEREQREKQERKDKEIQKQAIIDGDRESDESVAKFEQEHPDIFSLDQSQTDINANLMNEQKEYRTVKSDVKDSLHNSTASKEQIDSFIQDFGTLFFEYNNRLGIPDLSKEIKVDDQILTQLIPDNPPLLEQVKNSLNGRETVTAKELLATCIFQELIFRKEEAVSQKIAIIHEPTIESEETQTELRAKQHKILVELGIRRKEDFQDNEEIPALGIDDFRSLNEILSNLDSQSDREEFIDRFITEISQTMGKGEEAYSKEVSIIMEGIKGLDTLKLTFTSLQEDDRVVEVISDSGELNIEVFSQYYSTASETVSNQYAVSDSAFKLKPVLTDESEDTTNLESHQLSLEEARNDPVISDIARINPVITEHFLTPNSQVTIKPTEDGNIIEFQLDSKNSDHGLVLAINGETRQSQIFIADNPVMETDSTEQNILYRDLNSASANHLLFNQLNFPRNCFAPDQVDRTATEEKNDPYQFVKTILGEKDFPDTAILNLTPSLVKKIKNILVVALGEEIMDNPTPNDMQRLFVKHEWLDSHGRIKPSINDQLALIYQESKR